MKELKDYLHLYLGANLIYGMTDVQYTIRGCHHTERHADKLTVFVVDEDGQEDALPVDENTKIILRPLSDMSEEEMKELYLIVFGRKFMGDNITHRDIGKKTERWVLWSGLERLFVYKDGDIGADCDLEYHSVPSATVVKWQLSKHFDLFNLIELGLAIDKSTLTPDKTK